MLCFTLQVFNSQKRLLLEVVELIILCFFFNSLFVFVSWWWWFVVFLGYHGVQEEVKVKSIAFLLIGLLNRWLIHSCLYLCLGFWFFLIRRNTFGYCLCAVFYRWFGRTFSYLILGLWKCATLWWNSARSILGTWSQRSLRRLRTRFGVIIDCLSSLMSAGILLAAWELSSRWPWWSQRLLRILINASLVCWPFGGHSYRLLRVLTFTLFCQSWRMTAASRIHI